MLDPLFILKNQGKGAMYPFTRELCHPIIDRCQHATPGGNGTVFLRFQKIPTLCLREQLLLLAAR